MATDVSNEPVAVRTGDAKRARSPLYRNVYANFCQGQLGAFDITVSFFQTVNADGTGMPINEEQVSVTMSPIQFKLFAQLCNALTEGYEKTFAPIIVPAGAGNPLLASGDIVKYMLEAKAKMEAGGLVGASMPSDSSTEKPPPAERSRAARPKKAKKL
jgi:hypothetical protein